MNTELSLAMVQPDLFPHHEAFSQPPAPLSPCAQRTVRRALILLEQQLREPGASFTSTSTVRDWLRLQMTLLEHEEFTVLWLDNQHRLVAHETLFKGTINSTLVHPREVVKPGLRHNSAAAILAHNHPSGYAEPSDTDRRITQRLKEALTLVDIRLLDHLIVGGMEVVSFAERGWL
ncbi:DNA repair protein RadC [Enterobacteriaceae bacterium H11S18]|uniref:RadC family protein n=1 Tax=Dryocola clanedunensis TaxID=2925396 RepID=UPI0022F09E35|nr:DNA repair protein RadC [Dryocola clanedunensis]MCT4710734.1 DNA repair protein RadC [Dryocola clanedunensis]